jgi:hypothetical protein
MSWDLRRKRRKLNQCKIKQAANWIIIKNLKIAASFAKKEEAKKPFVCLWKIIIRAFYAMYLWASSCIVHSNLGNWWGTWWSISLKNFILIVPKIKKESISSWGAFDILWLLNKKKSARPMVKSANKIKLVFSI